VTRVSVGVQSLVAGEVAAVHRAQSLDQVERVMAEVAGIAVRNVDLIYGLPGQNAETWSASIDRTIALGANEIYLYPLYVRPFTGMGQSATGPDHRVALYRAGRDRLLNAGFSQVSMRMFRLGGSSESGPAYRCQTDGMVGLGAGARSYTRSLHYASPYAVPQAQVRMAIARWVAQTDEDFGLCRHGFRLDAAEQRRRYLILSLLEGRLDRDEYASRFSDDVLAHMPKLSQAAAVGLVEETPAALTLTELGRECSDVLGHWLQSSTVRALRAEWEAG
jgi:oxygen-independent coproporphyrinogen-3 oxidase